MNFHGWFNAVEAAFWIAMGGVLAFRTRSMPARFRRLSGVAAIALICFGITDVIEVFTGAWYEPVALLAFNAICLATLLGCLLRYRAIR